VSRLREAFADGPAFVPYLAAGDPDADASRTYVEALVDGGADIVELGLPFSEPIAEGPTIQSAVARSLEGGMTPPMFFELVEDLDVEVPLVCMTYYNLIYQFGDGRGPRPFVERAAEVGLDGFVVPDLPVEEADPLRAACDDLGRDLVFIVAPTTRDERLDRIRSLCSGYVYVQARLGVTGARADLSSDTADSLARVADWDLPKAVGFGISTREQAAEVIAAGADGVIVGSALVDLVADGHERGASTEAVADELRSKARELAAGVRAARPASEPERT
jgi:tryptophan synthase alpha chain